MSEIVRAGSYTGKGISADYGKSSKKNTDFVRVAIKIVGGEFDGRIVNRDLYFTENTQVRTLDALRALGCTFPGNDPTDTTGFGSTEVNFTVEHEKYTTTEGEEKTVAKIGFINAAVGIKPEARMSVADKAALKQRLMGVIAAGSKPGNGAPKAGGTPPPF